MSGDLYFDNVVLLLHLDGSNGGTTFVDSSKYARSVLRIAGVTTSTAEKKFGTASGSFPGSTSHFIYTDDEAAFSFGGGDFTIEAWLYPTTLTNTFAPRGICCHRSGPTSNNSWSMRYDDTNILFDIGALSGTSVASSLTFPHTLAVNTWKHVALCRNGSTIRCFVDGVQIGTDKTYSDAFHDSTARLAVGAPSYGATPYFTGYIDDFRLTVGVGRYTTNFDPPTEAFPDSLYQNSLPGLLAVRRPTRQASFINRIRYQGL